MIKTFYGESITSEQGAKNLRVYKYAGGDESLIYKYITGKLAQLLVDHAQSSTIWFIQITAIGFLIVLSPHFILYFLDPPIQDFSMGVPAWLCFVQASCIFVYSVSLRSSKVLDNSDGKQARKIGASSPLGLMMDHGCDMLNTGILTITMTKMLRIGNSHYVYIVVMITIFQFYYATLEEYFVGGLFLPIINAVNEGVFLIIAICLFTGIAGSDVWLKDSIIKGTPNNIIMFYIMIAAGVPVLLMNLYNMLKKTSISEIISKSLIFWYLTLSVCLVFILSDSSIFQYEIWLLYIYVFMSAKIVNNMQVAHCSNEDFGQILPIPLLICIALNIFSVITLVVRDNQSFYKGFVIALFTFTALYYILYVFSVVNLLADILGIRVFLVGTNPANEPLKQAPPYTKEMENDGRQKP